MFRRYGFIKETSRPRNPHNVRIRRDRWRKFIKAHRIRKVHFTTSEEKIDGERPNILVSAKISLSNFLATSAATLFSAPSLIFSRSERNMKSGPINHDELSHHSGDSDSWETASIEAFESILDQNEFNLEIGTPTLCEQSVEPDIEDPIELIEQPDPIELPGEQIIETPDDLVEAVIGERIEATENEKSVGLTEDLISFNDKTFELVEHTTVLSAILLSIAVKALVVTPARLYVKHVMIKPLGFFMVKPAAFLVKTILNRRKAE